MKTKKLVTDAMLIAAYVVLSLISIKLPSIKVTFDGLPVLLAACLFGPLDGLIVGLMGSFVNQMLTYGFSATTLLWIIPAGLRGLLAGLYAKRRGFRLSFKQAAFICVVTALCVTLVNTAVMYIDSVVYQYAAEYIVVMLPVRIAAGIATAVIYAAVLPPLLRILRGERSGD